MSSRTRMGSWLRSGIWLRHCSGWSRIALAMVEVLESLQVWLKDMTELRRMFAVWIRATLKRRVNLGEHLPEVNDLQEQELRCVPLVQ